MEGFGSDRLGHSLHRELNRFGDPAEVFGRALFSPGCGRDLKGFEERLSLGNDGFQRLPQHFPPLTESSSRHTLNLREQRQRPGHVCTRVQSNNGGRHLGRRGEGLRRASFSANAPDLGREEQEQQERIKELESAMSSGDASAWRDSLSFFKRSQKPTAAILLKSMLRGTEVVDPVVEHRVALNLKREGLVQQLLELRERQAHFDTDMVKCQMLRSFLNNEVSDPNRVLIDFWLARLELARVTFPEDDHKDHEVVDQETGDVHLDESAASHLFGKLQQYTRDRRNLVGDYRGQALNAREVFKNELKAAEQVLR